MGGIKGWPLVIIIVLALLLFAAPKLPAMARNLGKSMRIFKSEVKQMRKDGQDKSADSSEEDSDAAAEDSDAVEGTVLNNDGSPVNSSKNQSTGHSQEQK